MIEAQSLSKKYGTKTAVDDVSFTVQPGKVTGFLGPNGAGKSTTMRMMMGLDSPSGGRVSVNGRHYAQHKAPLREVGALLDAKAVHTRRSAYNHLRAMAATHGIPNSRVDEVIELTGLGPVAKKRVGGFSQRGRFRHNRDRSRHHVCAGARSRRNVRAECRSRAPREG
ncbi:hypothetical protein GCM10009672_21000 [Nesterenkonia lutea]